MKLIGIEFGNLRHGWCEFTILTDNGTFTWEISDVPRVPLREFEGALDRIKKGIEIKPIWLHLEPQELIINYNYDDSLIIITLDGKIQAQLENNISEFAYFLTMGLRRLYKSNKNAHDEKNWSSPIPDGSHL